MDSNQFAHQEQGKLLEQLPDYALCELMERVWGGFTTQKYKVVLGAVDWAAWNFDLHQFTIAIMIGNQSFLSTDNSATVVWEVFTRRPQMQDDQPASGFDKALNALMKRDIRTAITLMRGATYPNSIDQVVRQFVEGSDSMLDISDNINKLQGVAAQFRIVF